MYNKNKVRGFYYKIRLPYFLSLSLFLQYHHLISKLTLKVIKTMQSYNRISTDTVNLEMKMVMENNYLIMMNLDNVMEFCNTSFSS